MRTHLTTMLLPRGRRNQLLVLPEHLGPHAYRHATLEGFKVVLIYWEKLDYFGNVVGRFATLEEA